MTSKSDYQKEGWKKNHQQVSSIDQGYGYFPNNSERGTSNSISGSEGWANNSRQGTSSHANDSINWDGLVEDVFKNEIGQMAEDMKKKQQTWR